MAASTALLPGGGTLYMVRYIPGSWMMLSMAVSTTLLPGGSTLYMVRLLAVRFSVTFTYLKVV